jgi:hypothetical protein
MGFQERSLNNDDLLSTYLVTVYGLGVAAGFFIIEAVIRIYKRYKNKTTPTTDDAGTSTDKTVKRDQDMTTHQDISSKVASYGLYSKSRSVSPNWSEKMSEPSTIYDIVGNPITMIHDKPHVFVKVNGHLRPIPVERAGSFK